MHDIKAIRDEPDLFRQGWETRGLSDAAREVADILRLDGELRAAQTNFQASQARRNELSKQIGQAKGQKDEARAQALMIEVEALKGEIDRQYATEAELGPKLKDILARLASEIKKLVQTKAVADAMLAQGADPIGSTPEEFQARISADIQTVVADMRAVAAHLRTNQAAIR